MKHSSSKVRLIIVFCSLLISSSAFSREGPTWFPFEVISKNQQFKAKVFPETDSRITKDLRKANWKLQVSKTGQELWKTSYNFRETPPSNYVLLSDNGEVFIAINGWPRSSYKTNPVLIEVYTRQGRSKVIHDKDLIYDRKSLEGVYPEPSWLLYSYYPRLMGSTKGNIYLKLKTRDGKKHSIPVFP